MARPAKEKAVNIKALMVAMDHYIDSYTLQGRKADRITLDREQFEAFLKHSDGHPYYRNVPVHSK